MRKIHIIVSSIILLLTFISCTSNGSSAGSNSNATENQEAVAPSADKKCYASEREKALSGDTLRTKILSAEPDEYKSKCRNIFQISVNMRYQVLALYDGGTIEIDTTAIKDNLKRFLLNAENESTLPEYEEVELPLLGTRKVITRNNRIVFNYCDSVTKVNERVDKFHYLPIDSFAKIRPYYVEQIFAAYNEVRDEFAQKEFGKSFDACSDEQKNVCRLAYPCLVVDDYKAVFSVPTPPEAKNVTDMLEIVDDEELKNLETIVIEPQKLTAADKERNANKTVTLKKCRQ